MITKFSSLYAGHIDLGDMGQDATPANERRYSNEQLMTVFPKSEAIAKTMDRFRLWKNCRPVDLECQSIVCGTS